MRRLIDIIAKLDELDREDVICARPEWTTESAADVFHFAADYRIPEEATNLGLKYFLEVDVARQVMAEFGETPNVTLEEKCKRIIQYAIYDA